MTEPLETPSVPAPTSEVVSALSSRALMLATALGRAAWIGGVGLAAGFSLFAAAELGSRPTRAGLVALAGLGLGWLLREFFRGFAALLLASAEQSEAVGRMEQRVSARLEELSRIVQSQGLARSGPDPKTVAIAAFHRAVRDADWLEAEARWGALADAYPNDPDLDRLQAEHRQARHEAAQLILARVEAAREVNDPDRVLELRDSLKPLVDREALMDLDRGLAKWFMMLIHRRLRTGTIRPDVAMLAARVADSLDETPEGASLRASLPTLRRAAGLCSRCAQPYAGVADACPACISTPIANPRDPSVNGQQTTDPDPAFEDEA